MYMYTGNSIILDPSLIYRQQGKQYFVKNTGFYAETAMW